MEKKIGKDSNKDEKNRGFIIIWKWNSFRNN